VSARATHLKAAKGNALLTTTERKKMKTTLKRVALVAIAAMGLGLLSTAPSNAYLNTSGAVTFDVSSTTATAGVAETASVTVTIGFTSTVAYESMMVRATGSGAGGTAYLMLQTGDSVNVRTGGALAAVGTEVAATSGTGAAVASTTNGTTATYVSAKLTFAVRDLANVGSFPYTLSMYDGPSNTLLASKAITITVSALDLTASATYTKLYVNQSTVAGAARVEADSALVVASGASASALATPVKVGTVWAVVHNAADTDTVRGSTVGNTGIASSDSITLVMTGPGLLSVPGSSTKAKQVQLKHNETAVVWSDGTAGTGTITGYTGTTLSSTYKLAQAAKTVTFTGPVASVTVAKGPWNKNGSNLGYSDTLVTRMVTGIALDSASNGGAAALNTYGNLYAISSDTKVISANSLLNYAACSIETATTGAFVCALNAVDSGTATITISDSITVAGSSFTTKSVEITVAGAAFTGTVAFDKASYAVNDKAILTITAKDRSGRTIAEGSANPLTSLKWDGNAPVFSSAGDFQNLVTQLNGTLSFVNGVDTYVVYMPSTAGSFTLKGMTSGETVTASTLLTFTITDATKDAADAATDAALEATDAAYAAQDAAQLAAEAADAATAAAEAATAAVEDLATQVASLFADLQKQITTLANVVAKIAKKVKA